MDNRKDRLVVVSFTSDVRIKGSDSLKKAMTFGPFNLEEAERKLASLGWTKNTGGCLEGYHSWSPPKEIAGEGWHPALNASAEIHELNEVFPTELEVRCVNDQESMWAIIPASKWA